MGIGTRLLLLQSLCVMMAGLGIFKDGDPGAIHAWVAASIVVFAINLSREPTP